METDGFYNSENSEGDEKAYVESYNYARPFLAMVILVGFVGFISFIFGITAFVNWIFNLITQ
jgi:uncharacterized protein YdaL